MKRAVATILIAAAAASCRGANAPRRLAPDQAAEMYIRLVLALGDRDGDSLDMYRGPAQWQRDARSKRATLDAIRADAAALTAQLDGDPVRRAFLARQLNALVARIDIIRGARPPFREEVRRLFDVEVDVPSSDASAPLRAEIDRLLPGRGSLPERYAAFERRFVIPADRLESVLTRAIAGCRAATAQHVTLPDDERIELSFGRNMAWSAYTRYQGRFVSRMTVNADLPLTVDRALDLACHESYPGHHLIYALLEKQFGSGRPEFLAQLLFSPQSMLHESAASNAPALAFPDADRTAFERDQLFPAAGLDGSTAGEYVRISRLVDALHREEGRIVADYLDGRLDFPRASAALERDALMPGADATLKFVNQFRSYAATYTFGRDAFAAQVGHDWTSYLAAVGDPGQGGKR